MTAGRRVVLALAVGVAVLVGAGGCGRAQGVAETRRDLELAGYRDVEVTLRTGGGIGVARVQASAAEAPPAEKAAEVAWTTLPVRFDQLVVALGDRTTSFTYLDLAGRFGPRDPSLDRKQVDEQVVRSGLELMVLLSAGAMLSVGVVVVIGLAALRTARRGRRQLAGPTSGLEAGSAAGASDGADEMPS